MLRLTFPFSRDVEGEGGRGGPWRICALMRYTYALAHVCVCVTFVCTVVRGASSLRSILAFLDLLSPVNLETWFYVYGARGHRRVRDARPSTPDGDAYLYSPIPRLRRILCVYAPTYVYAPTRVYAPDAATRVLAGTDERHMSRIAIRIVHAMILCPWHVSIWCSKCSRTTK